MKKVSLLILAALFSVFMVNAQTLQIAGSTAAIGGVSQFYYDAKEDVLYACGTVSKADGKDIDMIMCWDGSGWTPKGHVSSLFTMSYPTMGSIVRANDTLYALGAFKVAIGLVELVYWNGSDWQGTDFGLIYSNKHRKLEVYKNTLYAIGAGRGMPVNSTEYLDLSTVAYWNGNSFVSTNYPGQCEGLGDGVVYNGKLYVGDYAWDGAAWATYGLDLTGCSGGDFRIGVHNNELIISVPVDGVTTIYAFDGSNFRTIASNIDHYITDIISLGNKLAVCGNFRSFNGQELKEVALWDGTTWSGIPNFGGNCNTVGNYKGQLLLSSADAMPIYDFTNIQNPIPLGTIAKFGEPVTGIQENNNLTIYEFSLENCYPNPFNPATKISYSLPQPEFVSLKIYNVLGQEIQTLVNTMQTTGVYSINFNASELAGGIYYYSLQAGRIFKETKKMLLLK